MIELTVSELAAFLLISGCVGLIGGLLVAVYEIKEK